ncbi:unnamed protein product [Dibothriocephalus latus]|uniref:Uncharacterized protein n=1 Tax=Dibothriocephalus latus TaxID=60516 RepID=A0A3P7Q4T5_DIBLA|nr:unnamed protein product [Dibothriocephalus latus]
MFGATSLLGRPGQTFAPLVGYSMLSAFTGKELISESGSLLAVSVSENEAMGSVTRLPRQADDKLQFLLSTLPEASFILACSVPLFVGCLQLVIWSYYKLHGSSQLHIKTERLKRCGRMYSGGGSPVGPKTLLSV